MKTALKMIRGTIIVGGLTALGFCTGIIAGVGVFEKSLKRRYPETVKAVMSSTEDKKIDPTLTTCDRRDEQFINNCLTLFD